MSRFLIFSGISLFISIHLQSQVLFTDKEIDFANTADTVSYLTDEEKKIIMYMNLARLDGKRFYKSFFADYVKNYNKRYATKIRGNNRYWVSLILDLNKIQGLRMLYPHKCLCDAARFHATDLGKSGLLGHSSSDGTNFPQRLKRFYPGIRKAGENCCCGQETALEIVCCLLLDDQEPSLGHRKNILSTEFKIAGVSIAPHSTCNPCCVIDLSE